MAAITVNGLNINNNSTYVVSEVNFRSIPKRDIQSVGISRQPGDKLTATEWKNKEITFKGHIFGSSASNLRSLVDTLQQNFAIQSLALAIDSDRTYTATLTDLQIPNQFYNTSYVPYEATFLAIDPFAYAPVTLASGTVVSGTLTYSGTLTISGSVFAQPTLTITPIGALAGNSQIKAMQIVHVPTTETVTVSGVFNYNSAITIDYKNYLVTMSGVTSDYTGIFSRFEPGVLAYTITIASGVRNGYNYKWSYQPRYYQ